MRLACCVACIACAGCLPLPENTSIARNGQLGRLEFELPQALAAQDSFPITVRFPTSARSPCAPTDLRTTTPNIATVSGTSVPPSTCDLVAELHGLAVGHAQIAARIGDLADTVELWVEVPDHLIITANWDVLGAPIHARTIHVPLSAPSCDAMTPCSLLEGCVAGRCRTALAIDVRSATDVPLGYATPAAFTTSTPGVVSFESGAGLRGWAGTTPGLWFVVPVSVGTTTLTASVFGLSDSVTIVVDP